MSFFILHFWKLNAHEMEKGSINIMLNISFCVPTKIESNASLQQYDFGFLKCFLSTHLSFVTQY